MKTYFLIIALFLLAQTLYAQLVPGPFECGKKVKELCQEFLDNGGMTCHYNEQIICHHKNQEDNDKDYCKPKATYSCRTFISTYGYLCNAKHCIMSHYRK